MHFFFYNELKVYIKGELKYLEEVHLGIGANKNYVLLTDPFLFFINEKCVRTYFDSIGKILLKKRGWVHFEIIYSVTEQPVNFYYAKP